MSLILCKLLSHDINPRSDWVLQFKDTFCDCEGRQLRTWSHTAVSNPAHGKVYSIQYYVIKFVSDFWQVGGFLWVCWFPPPIKLTAVYIKKKNRINNPYNFYFVSNVMLFKIFYNVFLI
jgi:hypothetical protein